MVPPLDVKSVMNFFLLDLQVMQQLLHLPTIPVQQWPLGVATYRGFPAHIPPHLAMGPSAKLGARKYLCNFQATVSSVVWRLAWYGGW